MTDVIYVDSVGNAIQVSATARMALSTGVTCFLLMDSVLPMSELLIENTYLSVPLSSVMITVSGVFVSTLSVNCVTTTVCDDGQGSCYHIIGIWPLI